MIERIVICSGGPKSELCSFQPYINNAQFIGVDRGALYLHDLGIVPVEIVGDFDSITNEEWLKITKQNIKITKVQAEKDETDTDLGLISAIKYNPQEVILTGVTGGRLDHFEAAIKSIYKMQLLHRNIHFKIKNFKNEISILLPGLHKIVQDENYQYLSFFAYENDVENVTIRGVKYETTNEMMHKGSSRFTSNELTSKEGYISFSSGICLMIRSSD